MIAKQLHNQSFYSVTPIKEQLSDGNTQGLFCLYKPTGKMNEILYFLHCPQKNTCSEKKLIFSFLLSFWRATTSQITTQIKEK